jgi:hypothetical protein
MLIFCSIAGPSLQAVAQLRLIKQRLKTNAYPAAVLEVELESAPCLVSMAPRRASPRKQTLDRRMPTYERPVIVEWNPSQALVMRASHRPRSSKAQKPR